MLVLGLLHLPGGVSSHSIVLFHLFRAEYLLRCKMRAQMRAAQIALESRDLPHRSFESRNVNLTPLKK